MGISVGGANVAEVYAGGDRITEVYRGADLVWQDKPRTRVDYAWEDARTSPYRIMFMGSSTTAGYEVLHSEQFVPQMTAHIVSNLLGVNATPTVKRTSGGITPPQANGFHFLNAGVGGATSATYWNSDRANVVSTYQPKLIVHMIGSNDLANGVAPATYRANVLKAINEINSQIPPAKHLLVHSFRRLDVNNPTYPWAQYRDALASIAADRTDTDFCDAERVLGDRWTGEEMFLGDKVHANWFGNTLLARAVAEYLNLDTHEGELIYGLDAADLAHLATDTRVRSWPAAAGSKINLPATVDADRNAPRLIQRIVGGEVVPDVDFYNGSLKMSADWGGAYAAPMTVLFVARMWNDNFGTNMKPVFSRRVSDDDGYMWLWRDTNANRVRAAMNSGTSDGIIVPRSVVDSPSVFAATFRENGWVTIYPNTTAGTDVPPTGTSSANGPWMKSLKLMTNTGENYWGEANVYAVRFIKGAGPEIVAQNMRELANLHNITLT